MKILDFGLAKAMAPAGASSVSSSALADSPTVMPPAMTEMGMVLGTAGYKSPEQARGRVVDSRADIWAFGGVFFEMLAGRPLFVGETVTDTLAAVLTREIDWSLLPASTPPGAVRLCAAASSATRADGCATSATRVGTARRFHPTAPASRSFGWPTA